MPCSTLRTSVAELLGASTTQPQTVVMLLYMPQPSYRCLRVGEGRTPRLADIYPRGPMDDASANGAGDCRFESC